MRDPGRLPVDDPELEPQAPGADGDRLAGVRDAQLGAPEDVDDVERAGRGHGLGERREGGHPEHLPLVRVDRDAFEALLDQVAEDAERRPPGIGRRTDDRDPAGRPQDLRDPGVVEERDRPAALLEVEEGALAAIALLARQVAASRSYGWPSAAGGMLRPTKPARTTIVTRYGRAS